MDIIKPKHFSVKEIFPPELCAKHKNSEWKLWLKLDPNYAMVVDYIRNRYLKEYGYSVINTWHSPKLINQFGRLDQCGLRTNTDKGQHPYGRAFDIKFTEIIKIGNANKRLELYERIRADLIAKINSGCKELQAVKGIETGIKWLHLDFRPTRDLCLFGK